MDRIIGMGFALATFLFVLVVVAVYGFQKKEESNTEVYGPPYEKVTVGYFEPGYEECQATVSPHVFDFQLTVKLGRWIELCKEQVDASGKSPK